MPGAKQRTAAGGLQGSPDPAPLAPKRGSRAINASAFRFTCREKQLVVVLGGHWLQGNLVTHALKSTDELALGANPVAFVEIRRA